MELINNTTKTLRDDLSVEIKEGSKLSIAAACFSIYAFQELKKQLSDIDELRFIFTSPTFITEKAKKEKREFYIPRLNRERSLYGTEFEIKLRNELTQKAIAKECAEWIKKKVSFKSNISDKTIQGGIVVDDVGYTPINNFTTIELGCEKGNVISTTIVKDNSLAKTLLADFNEIWNDNKVLQEVTDEVIDSITAAYNENSPDFIYFVTLYNIFNEFLEDVSEDVLPNEATGFKDSKIWSMLYNFQKDAALAIINKLEKYNGCILADSVGLGKTFTALAVIKYYENRNKSVLVLCPKKLTNNWNTYKDNYVNNPIASDRLRYDVLYHTDLNRTHGKSNGLDLDRLNWGNYDLVVIDESHNFRNGGKIVENPDENDKENRYVKLLKKVIRAGVKTKVLMLSATPVNNRFNDLKNQLALAYEGHTEYIDDKLNTTRSIDDIFKNAQRAFNTWSKWEPCDRTTENLLKMLDFDFFEVLDSVTIARSRKHIQKYYDTSDIGTFPTRLKPISLRPHLTDLKSAITYNQIFEQLMLLTLTIYTPTHFILPSIDKKGHAIDSKVKRGSEFSDDISAYDLILKNKERLLSFDEPTRFIFSHSALREGWDNPNVFQICTLKHSDSNTAKRQEVGRGLRLCVNQNGNRMDVESCGETVHDINVLTVVASESYKTFVTDLQSDIKTVLYDRPTVATSEYFKGKYIKVDDVPTLIDDETANAIEFYLIQNGYVDMKRKVTDKYRQEIKSGTVAELPDELKPMAEGIHTLIQSVYDDSILQDMFTDGHETKVKDNPLNDNFAKKEFQALWREINHKYAYTVEFDSDELIKKATAHIDEKLFVSELQYTTTIGRQKAEMNEYEVERGASFTGEKTRTQTLKHAETSQIKYDLIGKVAEGTTLTRKTVSAILQGIRADKLYMFKNNPEEFITKVIRLINEQKATMIVEHISYDTIEGEYDSTIFTAEKNTQSFDKAFLAKKAIQDYVFTDGSAEQSIERRFAEDLDAAEEVCVYAKLPRTFQIPTPVGNYSPDWAIAFYEGTVKHIFFVAETKGTMETLNLRPIEQAKISCAKKLFNEMSNSKVVYHDIDSYQSLLNIMNSI